MTELMLAPIVLFVYNRPYHTKLTLDALKDNLLAKESLLYVYSDGPKFDATQDQIDKIVEVRNIVKDLSGFNKVTVTESDHNKGLAQSVIHGVSEVINKHGKVIVLEDDLITSPAFLTYMNKTLSFYNKYKGVFSVSADIPSTGNFLIPAKYPYDVFCSLRFFSYGWGTWLDRWTDIDWEVKDYNEFITDKLAIEAFNRGGEDLADMLNLQMKGKIDSWAIRFAYAHFKNHAVSIMPVKTFIQHTGKDGSGTHVQKTIKLNQPQLSNKQEFRFNPNLYEDRNIINQFYSVFYSHKRNIVKKMINYISRKVTGNVPFTIKKKIYK